MARVSREQVTGDTRLRLEEAAALAFPDGSVSAGGLRKEAGRGRLAIERIAGKLYTTLNAIDEMCQLCRVQPKEPVSGSVQNASSKAAADRRRGSSSTAASSTPLDAARARLKLRRERYTNTSQPSTTPLGLANVHSLKPQ